MALPSPARPDSGNDRWAFAGWFTEANGGTRVFSGPTGTRFTAATTVYARWTVITAIDIRRDTPAAMLENFDWLKNERHPGEAVIFNRQNTAPSGYNWFFDQIWGGDGTLNWAIRWESSANITLAQRRNIATMLYEATNQWTRPLIGMPGWEFGEIPVTVVGWAVTDGARILERQPNELVWVNNTHANPQSMAGVRLDLMASAPNSMSRRINLNGVRNGTFQYSLDGTAATRGLHNRFDQYLWCTEFDFGAAGHGFDWGTRMRSARIATDSNNARVSTLNAQGQNTGGNAGSGVLLHEIGHSVCLYDLYGGTSRPPATSVADSGGNRNFGSGQLVTVMDSARATTLGAYDHWMIRYYWDWFYHHPTSWNAAGTQQTRFVRPANAPVR